MPEHEEIVMLINADDDNQEGRQNIMLS